MKRYIILWLFLISSYLGYAQKCGLDAPLPILVDQTVTYDITVDETQYLVTDLASNPLCEVELFFTNYVVFDMELTLISPAGERVQLIGPNSSPTEFTNHTIATKFDVTFVRDVDTARPDPEFLGLGERWDNSILPFRSRPAYAGSYKPFSGQLEDFVTGGIGGAWQLEITNNSLINTDVNPNEILDVRLIFCDESGAPPCCDADAGFINTALNIAACVGDDTLNLENIGPGYTLRRPDTLEYGYRFLVAQNGVLVGNDSISDLRIFPAGTYEICGLSFDRSQQNLIPEPDGSLTMDDIRNDLNGAAPSLCADITSGCITVIINGSSPPTPVSEVICPGDTLTIGDSTLVSAGSYDILLMNQAGCDSLINLELTIAEVTRDTLIETICEGEFFEVGTSTYDMSGFFSDTLQSVDLCDSIVFLDLTVALPQNVQLTETICAGEAFTVGAETFNVTGTYQVPLLSAVGCDSIVELQLTVLTPQPVILPPGDLSCNTPELTLDGSGSTGSTTLAFQWTDLAGNILGNNAEQTVTAPGSYVLEVSITENALTCSALDTVVVGGDLDMPVADAGPPVTLNCLSPEITIGTGNTSQGMEFVYSWDTPDGSFTSATDILQPSVNQAGEYRLNVLDTTNGCTANDTVTILADLSLPVADPGSDQTLDCNNSTVMLDGSNTVLDPGVTFTWGADNGSTLTGANTLTPEVAQPDRYWLALENPATGCTDTAFVTVSLDTVGPALVIAPAGVLNCEVRSLEIDATGSDQGAGFSFAWNTANGANIAAGENTLFPTVDGAGDYELSIENLNNGCISTGTISIIDTVNTVAATIVPPDALTCATSIINLDASASSAGAHITYNWTTTNGNILTAVDAAAIDIDEPGQYQITVLDEFTRCSASESVTVVENRTFPVAAIASGTATLTCAETSVALDGSGSSTGPTITYQWTGPGAIDAPTAITTATTEPGQYILEVTDTSSGCVSSDTVLVDQNIADPQIVSVTADDLSCANNSTDLSIVATSPSGVQNLRLEIDGPGLSADTNTLSLVLTRPGVYTIVVVDTLNGCSAMESITVNADSDFPRADAGPDQELNCNVSEVNLGGPNTSSGPEFSYSWFTTEGNLTGPNNTPSTTANVGGVYGLIVTNTTNSCADTAFTNVAVNTQSPFVDAGIDQQLSCSVSLVTLDGSNSDSAPGLQFSWSGPCVTTPADQPIVQVDCEGTYILQIENTLTGCSGADTVVVGIDNNFPRAVVNSTAELSCSTGNVVLDGSASEGGSTEWFFEGVPLGTTSLTPEVSEAGTYSLVITNIIAGCSDTANVQVGFNCQPMIDLVSAPDPLSCDQRAVDLTVNVEPAGPDYVFRWTAAGGGDCFLGPQDLATARVSCPDTYQLIATNATLNLSDTITVTVTGNTIDPSLVIVPPNPITCAVPSTTIDASGSSAGPDFQYTWTSPEGDTISDQNIISVDSGGIYTLEITNITNGCRSIDVVEVIDEQALPDVTFNTEVLPCFQDTLTLSAVVLPTTGNYVYSWSGPGIQTRPESSAILIDQPGAYTLEITEPLSGCTVTETANVSQPACPPCLTVADPVELNCNQLTQALALTFCEPCTGCSVQWSTIDGQIDSGADSATPQISQPGTYIVTATDPQGLNSRMTVVVTGDFELPAADAGPDRELNCRSVEVSVGQLFSVGPEFLYSWIDDGQQQVSDQPQFTTSIPGIYTFLVTDTTNGCLASDEVLVIADTVAPQVSIAAPPVLNCLNPSITLDASASVVAHDAIFRWTSASGDPVTGENSPTPVIDAPGNYSLLIEDAVNGCSTTGTIAVGGDFTPPPVAAIPDAVLNCRDVDATLNGNTPGPTGFDFQWCRLEADGTLSGCDAAIDLLVSDAGTFVFQLIDQANGCDSSVQVIVSEDVQAPIVEAGPNDTLNCIANTVQLTGSVDFSASPQLQLSWSATNNSQLSDDTALTPSVTTPDTYYLTAFNEENFCSATDSVIIVEDTEFPVADAGPDRTLTCMPASLELTGQASTTKGQMAINWSTDDGSILSPNGNVTLSINGAGTYRLAVADLSNGCVSTDEVEVFADTDAPTALIDDSLPLSLSCDRDTVTLDATTSFSQGPDPLSYQWAVVAADGPILGGVTSPQVQVTDLGIYRLVVQDPANSCRDTIDITIEGDFAQPQISILTPTPLTCNVSTSILDASGSASGNNFIYSWRAPGGELLVTDAATIEVDEVGDYEFSVLNLSNGCSSSSIVSVTADTLSPVTTISTPDILDCISRATNIDGRGSSAGDRYQYSWTSANGVILAGQDSLVVRVGAPGNYLLQIDDLQNGCSAQQAVEVVEIANPIAGATVLTSDPKCLDDQNGSILIESVDSGTDPFTYAIEDRTFISNNQFNNLGPGDYRLTIQGSDGCSYETTVTLNAPIGIGVDLGPDRTINLGDSTSLEAQVSGSPLDSLNWEPGGIFEDPQALIQTVKPQKNSLYKVTVRNEDGCLATDQVLIKVNSTPSLYFPTAFSPNGDDQNDTFTIFAGSNVRIINRLQIFNRWGALIYSRDSFAPNDATTGWDGTYDGQLLNPAVFVYVAEVEFVDGTTKMFKGDVVLLH